MQKINAPDRKTIEQYLFKNGYIIKEIIQENLLEDNILFSLKE